MLSLPTESGVQAVSMEPGFRTESMSLSGNTSMIYSISVPEEVEEGAVPLVLALHGGNGDAGSAEGFMECLPIPALKGLDAIIFAPTGGEWWQELHTMRVVELVRLAKMFWPIDTNKVVVTGYSNGGTGSVYFAKNFPETFSAAIPMGGNYMEPTCPLIPTYLIHGEEDEFYSPVLLQQTVSGLQASDCDIQLEFVPGATHGAACTMITQLAGASFWLQNEVWKE